MIELINVNKHFRLKKDGFSVLNNINVTFKKGKFYAVMGPSGSGKSTLLQLIGLLDNKFSGTIKIDGQDINELSENKISNLRKDKIGFVFQSFFLNANMKAYENVMIPLYINQNIRKSDRKNMLLMF